MEIRGKTALILGAAQGIGKAVGLALAKAGARVVLTYYDWPEASEQMQKEFASLNCDFLAVKVL
jgi:3-oxoacyl-[acyl-carrier protein] reductase